MGGVTGWHFDHGSDRSGISQETHDQNARLCSQIAIWRRPSRGGDAARQLETPRPIVGAIPSCGRCVAW